MEHMLGFDERIKGRFRIAAFLLGGTLGAEVAGGILTNSLALLSDSLHVLDDLSSLLLGWSALYLASKPATDTRTFGWHRAEVLASFVNGLALGVLGLLILFGAIKRFIHPQDVKTIGMTLVGLVGLLANIVVVILMSSDAKRDLNIKGVYLHALGDTLSSVGVILGGIGIMATGWVLLDPIVSIGITGAVLLAASRLLRESSHILLEGVPRGIDLEDVRKALLALDGVKGVHDLHIWALCSNINSLSAHITIEEDQREQIRDIQDRVEEKLRSAFNISHTTLQMDCPTCEESRTTFPSGHN